MKFVQLIEMKTDRYPEIEKLHEKWLAATEGSRTVKLEWVMQDRDDPSRYVIMVLFDSFEDAMKNNDLAATGEIAAGMSSLTAEPAIFRNLDLLRVDES